MTTNRTKIKSIDAADFWCGAGGTSTGLVAAVKELGYDLQLTAVNHWQIAVDTHSTNHPKARHFCKAVDQLSPLELFPDRRLKILVASPECTHHSRARGGKPRDEQRRADAWDIKRWVEKLFVENLLIENVKEFVDWGPLGADGKPLKSKKGVYFNAFIDFLKIMYQVEWRVLNCADYGDATTRERFFLIARRGNRKKIFFPEPTHASRSEIEKAKNQPGLFGDKANLKPWRAAREIIDWSIPGKSVFGRKKPLSINTMRRIFAGLFKYSLKPFVMGTGGPTGQQRPRSIDDPVRTILTDGRQNLFVPYMVNLKATDRRDRSIDEPCFTQCSGNHQMLVEPLLVNLSHTKNRDETMCKPLDLPLPVVCGKGMLGLVEPFLVKFYGGQSAASVDNPIPTITANYEHYGLAEPFVLPNEGFFRGNQPRGIDSPIPTITQRGAGAVVEPFITSYHSGNGAENRNHSVEQLLPTADTSNRFAVAEPFIIPCNHGKDERAHSVEEPMKTITGIDAWGKVEPFLVKYHGNENGAHSVDEQSSTVTTKDRQGIAEPFLVRFQNNQEAQGVDEPLNTITSRTKHGVVEVSFKPEDGETGVCFPQLGIIVFIRFRMLQPHELAAAMSFPKNYYFAGTRDDKVKQIGNAVPVQTAKALCKAILEK